MGQKVHPHGFRIGYLYGWESRWYAGKHYTELLHEDLKVRSTIERMLPDAGVAKVEIDRNANQVTVTIHTARPGIVIGRGGQRVDELRATLEKLAGRRMRVNIVEIRMPEIEAALVARSVADQLERRVSHRRAMKQAVLRAMQRGALGIKIKVSGRLGGGEMSRKDKEMVGRVPLHTLRADIDYGTAEARTTLGRIGVKVWVYKGDIRFETEERERPAEEEEETPAPGAAAAPEVTPAPAPAPTPAPAPAE